MLQALRFLYDYNTWAMQRVLDAATAYYDVLEARAVIEIARQDVDNLKRVEAVTVEQVNALLREFLKPERSVTGYLLPQEPS